MASTLGNKIEDESMITDKDTGNLFLQNPVLKVTKNVVLNIRITEGTKANIDYLTKKHKMSQSDLVTVLVADAICRDGKGKNKKKCVYSVLYQTMKARKANATDLAHWTRKSPATISYKLNGKGEWTLGEMLAIKDGLKSEEDIEVLFRREML